MGAPQIDKTNVGKIAERIVANELEARGFIVRDLNLERLAANVDLIAGKNGRTWQIQVKGSTYDKQHGWWFSYGFCTEEHIEKCDVPFFNRRTGAFHADIVVHVCVKTPKEYQCVVLPIDVAETAAQTNLALFRMKKYDGSGHKPGKVTFRFYLKKARTPERQKLLDRELELVTPYKDKWDFEMTGQSQVIS
jgi:Holliday junction resolvase-like predicted endonuclease